MKYRTTSSIVAIILVAALLLTQVACDQTKISALVNTLGNAASSLAALQGNATLAQKLKDDTAKATQQILDWKNGTPTDMAIQALNLVLDDLNLIPFAGPYIPLISLAVVTAQSIIAILAPKASPPVAAAEKAKLSKSKVTGVKAAKNSDDFKKEWNAICAKNPQLAGATIQ